jgi:MoaA/NifB/PqqE/SkfB family radical SAM enzyme
MSQLKTDAIVSFKSIMIKGIRAKWIRFRLRLFILATAISNGANPIQGYRQAKALREKRKKIHGLPDISRFVKVQNRFYWSENIPGWPSKALEVFIRNELNRGVNTPVASPLQTAIFAITSRCGLRCKHCYEWDNLDAEEHLGTAELMTILYKFQQTGLTHIQFSGGEPLARFDDLITLISRAQETMDCWILTSGYGLTPEKAVQLKNAGLTGAIISLDHWDETAHSEFRNNPRSFYWVREAAKNCREADILVSLSLCATREFTNQTNLYNYLELARQWGASFIRVLEPRSTGRFKGKDVMLNPESIRLLEDFFQKTNRDKEWEDYPIVMYPGFHQRKVGCFGAGDRYLYVDSKGDVHACPFCQHAVANAVTDSLPDALSLLRKKGCHEFEHGAVV